VLAAIIDVLLWCCMLLAGPRVLKILQMLLPEQQQQQQMQQLCSYDIY
jgi:hypothetical protein